jgi:hypothetical protein
MRRNLNTIFLLLSLPISILSALRSQAEVIDRVIAVVDGKVLTHLSLEKIRLMQEIFSGTTAPSTASVEIQNHDQKFLDLIIDQALIREQMVQYAEVEVSPNEVESELRKLALEWSGKESFETALKSRRLTLDELKSRIHFQLAVLKFVDARFRQFTLVEQREISDYYHQVFLPEVNEKKLTAPALVEVEEKIRALLVEEKVNQQLAEWLKSLRQNASIQILN